MNGKRPNWLSSLTARLFKKKELPPPSLEVEEDGFSYVRREGKTAVRWADVKEVFAFKVDLWSFDMICIGFRVSDDGRYWEIDEQMGGYNHVLAAMTRAFPGLVSDWWERVAFPAFKTNRTTLWGPTVSQRRKQS